MTTKTVYLFDPVTGNYTGQCVVYPSPLEPGNFIIPTSSTDIPPPALNAGDIAVFANGAWTVIPAPVPPAPTLAQVQATQLALMESSYHTANTAPIAYMATTFQADDASQALISDVLTAAGGTLPTGFTWYDANNAAVAMTFAQLQGLATAILLRGQPLFIHKQTQKAAIRAATTVAQVQAVVW